MECPMVGLCPTRLREAPNIFKAIANVTGTMSEGSWNTLTMTNPPIIGTPILHIHGTQDEVVPIDGSMGVDGGWGGAPPVDSIVSYWSSIHNCNAIDTLFSTKYNCLSLPLGHRQQQSLVLQN